MDDLISRRAAIEQSIVLRDISNPDKEWEVVTVGTIKHLKSVQPAQKWIPVSERLPEDDHIVLIWIYDDRINYVSTGFYDNGWEMWLDHYEEMVNVVAWMPLPQPYKAESGDKE